MASQTISASNLESHVGREIGVGPWITMDQERIDRFAVCTGDRQWIHTNPARAAQESPFKATIAHGYLLLATIAPSVLELLIQPARIRSALNYGLDRVRFVAPVVVDDRVRNRVTLVAVDRKGGGRTLITTEHTIEIEGRDKPAVLARALAMAVE